MGSMLSAFWGNSAASTNGANAGQHPFSPEQQQAEAARIAAGDAKWARLVSCALTPQQQTERWDAQCGRVAQLQGISQQQVQDMLDGPRDHPYNLLTEEEMQELMASNPTGF